MKFSINKNTLQTTLQLLSKAIPTRSTLPIIGCALFTHKDLNKTYYKQSAIYQLFLGIWISLCYAFWYLHGQDASNLSRELSLRLSSDAGIIGLILQQFSFSLINIFGYIPFKSHA